MKQIDDPHQYDLKDFIERMGEALLPEIDNDVSTHLLHSNDEYQRLRHRRRELQQQYRCIQDAMEGEGVISLNEEEHKALVEYLILLSKSENMERMQLYFRGHADCFSYLKKIGAIGI